jgi:hypothetical protein
MKTIFSLILFKKERADFVLLSKAYGKGSKKCLVLVPVRFCYLGGERNLDGK